MSFLDIQSLVSDSDIPFEERISADQNDIRIWLDYYSHKLATLSSFEEKVFVLQRAVKVFPRSYKLWNAYLKLVVEQYTSFSLQKTLIIAGLFENALQLLNKSPLLWVHYLQFLLDHLSTDVTAIRKCFNDSLYSLPISQHHHIWPLYLDFANTIGGPTGASVYSKYLEYADHDMLANSSGLSIDKIILKLIEFGDFDLAYFWIVKFQSDITNYYTLEESPVALLDTFLDALIKIAPGSAASKMELLILNCIGQFPDQLGPLYVKLLMYFVDQRHFDKIRHFSSRALTECVTVQDFVLVFDFYTEFEQSLVENMIAKDADDDELNFRIAYLETFLDNRQLMLNDMKLRQNPNNLDEWISRIDLFQDPSQQLATFVSALTTINPLKVNSAKFSLCDLWIKYANFYSDSDDIDTASLIYSRAIKSQFKTPDDLVKIYMTWSETLLGAGRDEDSTSILEKVLLVNEYNSVNYEDLKLSVQVRVHKLEKLWQFYLDLLESMIDEPSDPKIDLVVRGYEKMIELKIASLRTILAFAEFLQSQHHYEKSFQVYEKGLGLFNDDKVHFEIWNAYLPVLLKTKNQPLERVRDLFEQSITDSCPLLSKPLFVLYSQFEQDHGLLLKAAKILEKGLLVMSTWLEKNYSKLNPQERDAVSKNKCDLYELAIHKVSTFLKDADKLRTIYGQALEDSHLSLKQTVHFSVKYVDLETDQNQFVRVRAILQFATKLASPDSEVMKEVWQKWEQFELKHGSESTFKSMLRFKRLVKTDFESEVALRETINPMGFVKSGEKSTDTENPDAIDLDMDDM